MISTVWSQEFLNVLRSFGTTGCIFVRRIGNDYLRGYHRQIVSNVLFTGTKYLDKFLLHRYYLLSATC